MCQIWHSEFFPFFSSSPTSVIESYDLGYIISGNFVNENGTIRLGYILKTDINGNVQWYQVLGQNDDGTGVMNIHQTNDGGYILSGSTGIFEWWGDTFVMKLNSCGEKEWCKIFRLMDKDMDFGQTTFQVPGGYIIQVRRGGDLFGKDHVMLVRLDNYGNILWKQLYGQTDTLIDGLDAYSMMITPDYKYLLSGDGYYPNPNTTGPKYLRPFLLKIDSSGILEWIRPMNSYENQTYFGECFKSIMDNEDNIYSCGRHIIDAGPNVGDKPTLFKSDSLGNPVLYKDIRIDTYAAIGNTINWFSDSTIVIGDGWNISGVPGTGTQEVTKLDRQGNIIKTTPIITTDYIFQDGVTTFDNDLVLVSGINDGYMWNTFAWKLTSELEPAGLYTGSITYDSLCPHPIATDTIPLDCDVVGIDEANENPDAMAMKVYPNPASSVLHIDFPDVLQVKTNTPYFTASTSYYQWKSATLGIYDIKGTQIQSLEILKDQKQLDLDVSAWPRGMYFLRLVYMDRPVSGRTVVIR